MQCIKNEFCEICSKFAYLNCRVLGNQKSRPTNSIFCAVPMWLYFRMSDADIVNFFFVVNLWCRPIFGS